MSHTTLNQAAPAADPSAATVASSGVHTPPSVLDGPRGIPFGRLMTMELRKQVDTRSGKAVVAASIALSVLLVVVTAIWGGAADKTLEVFLSVGATGALLILPVIAILAGTSEFSQRTALVTFALEPRRSRVATAKLLSALVIGLVAILVTILAAVLAVWVGARLDGGSGTAVYTVPWAVAGGMLLGQVLNFTQGVAFGLVMGKPAPAILAFYLLPTAWSLATALIPRLATAGQWLDLSRALGPLSGATMAGADWAHLAVASSVWVILPLVAGYLILARREIR